MTRVPILMYHSVSAQASPAFRRFAVAPARFGDHLAALRDAGYTSLTLAEYLERRAAPAALPARPVVLTFDDAFEDFYTEALPRLEACGFRASLYVPTAYVGGTSRWLEQEGEADRPVMSWAQLRDAHARGTECGGHSHTHVSLDLLPPAGVRAQVTRGRAELEDHLGVPALTFAYPFGHYGAATARAVQEAGYRGACGVRDLIALPDSPPFALPRLTVTANMTPGDVLRLAARAPSAAAFAVSQTRRGLSRLVRQVAGSRP